MRISRLVLTSAALTALIAAPVVAVPDAAHNRSAATSVTLGTTDGAINSCGDITVLMSSTAPGGPTWTAPIDGVITSWKHGGGPNPGSLRLLVVAPSTVTPGAFAIASKSANQAITPNVFNTFAARLPIAAGQQLALDVDATGNVFCATLGQPGDVLIYALGFDAGTANEFVTTVNTAGVRLNLSAVVEPDQDHDTFGDISQDLCPQSAATQGACPAPDTKVTKAPKKSSPKRKPKIKFSSTVAGSTFMCAVDKAGAKPCSSPFKKRFKLGKHKVVITAITPFGIADPTPVTVKFKVTKPPR